MPCQWSSSDLPRVLRILRERSLLSDIFYLKLLPAGLKASLGADSSTSKLAGLHTDLRNLAQPDYLFESQQSTKELHW